MTLIAEGGAHPKTAQDLAGHSDIRLTMGVYTQMNVKNQADALKKLPRLNPHGTGVCDHGEEVLREMFLDSDPERADAVGANRKETGVMLSKTQPSANERPDAVSENDSHSSKSSTPGRSFTLACENPARSNTDGVEFAGRSAGVNGQAGIAFPTTGENADDALAPSLPWRRSGSSSAPAMSRLPTRPL